MGDANFPRCVVQCEIQFLDGQNGAGDGGGEGPIPAGYFYDAKGNQWSAAAWPGRNASQQVTLTGTQLTVVVGLSQNNGEITALAFQGVAQVSGAPNFAISASPASLSSARQSGDLDDHHRH